MPDSTAPSEDPEYQGPATQFRSTGVFVWPFTGLVEAWTGRATRMMKVHARFVSGLAMILGSQVATAEALRSSLYLHNAPDQRATLVFDAGKIVVFERDNAQIDELRSAVKKSGITAADIEQSRLAGLVWAQAPPGLSDGQGVRELVASIAVARAAGAEATPQAGDGATGTGFNLVFNLTLSLPEGAHV